LQDGVIKIKLKNAQKPKKKINIDFSKHKIISKRDDLTTYLYSYKERVSNHQLVISISMANLLVLILIMLM
jgi:hypothetical protein